MSLLAFFASAAAAATSFGHLINNSTTRTLDIPLSPPTGKQIIDGNYQSYSIEFSYMLDYAGNNSNPNRYSKQLLQNLADISGAFPIIRAGGTTQNRAVFVSNQTEALIQTFSASNADQPSSLTIGPTWIESFQQFPRETKYIYGLNFYDGSYGLNQTVLEATNAVQGLSDSLYAFEIGNEVDGWPGGSRRPSNWTIDRYVAQWLEFATAVEEKAIGIDNSNLEPLFQGCAFEAPRFLGYNKTPFWNVENAIRYGMNSTSGVTKTIADHDYMGSACSGTTQVATIEFNLLNHTHTTSIAYYHDYLGNVSAEAGVTYVLGETNSVSCEGLAGVSDVYAAALWAIDYVLYMASLKVKRLYFHMGTPYRYSAWQPVATGTSAPHIKPLYYGNIFTSTAFSGGNKQVSVIANETLFTAYGIYDASRGGQLESVAILNLETFNSTSLASRRPQVIVKLPIDCSKATVQRLTSPGVEVSRNITFAGRSVSDADGSIVGLESKEAVKQNQVSIAAGEAVLITF